jgi:lysyl-tRNA synthetase class II
LRSFADYFDRLTNFEEAKEAATKAGIQVPEDCQAIGQLLNEAFEQKVEATLIQLRSCTILAIPPAIEIAALIQKVV